MDPVSNFARIEAKLDKILEEIPGLKSDLRMNTHQTSLNTESLQDHMEQTMILKGELHKEKEITNTRFIPLERSHYVWGFVGKAIVTTVVVLSAVAGILRFILSR